MKKYIVLSAVIFLAVIITFSCKKNTDNIDIQQIPNQLSESSQNIKNKILSFKERMNSNFKTGSDLCIDSAVWYVEAAVNYDYGDVTNNREGLDIDTAYFSVPLSDGKVTTTQAAVAYGKIVDSLTVQYSNLPANAHLVFADVFSKDSVAGSVTFGLLGAFSYGPIIIIQNFDPETDYWIMGWATINNGGYCGGPYADTETDKDAATEIARRIRGAFGYQSGRYTATDVVNMEVWPSGDVYINHELIPHYCNFINTEDLIPEDNLEDYWLFYRWSAYSHFEPCLNPDEMYFWWFGSELVSNDLLYDCFPDIIGGKNLTSIYMEGGNTTTYPYYAYEHVLTNTYANWILSQDPPDSF